ncbi:MAG: DUF4292 domain-containing protein [Bacteroidota bacterium]|jgi:hypothetical protein
MIKKISYLFLIIVLLSACTATKKTISDKTEANPLQWKSELKTLALSATINADYHGQSNSARIKMTIAGTDSITMTVIGPFGITLGKLYARPDYFVFYNMFNDEVIEGIASAKNLKEAAMIPLSFEQIVHLLRSESPQKPELYVKSIQTSEGTFKYENTSNNESNDYVFLNGNNQICRYLNNMKDGKTSMELLYADYENYSGFYLAKSLSFSFPEINGKLTIDVSDFQVNKNINQQFSFKIPDKIKRIKLD